MIENLIHLISHMKSRGVHFEQGLTDEECLSIEALLSFRFPPDLRGFLQIGVPLGPEFPVWRGEGLKHTGDLMYYPIESYLFYLEHDDEFYWPPSWGKKHSESTAAMYFAKHLLESSPKLIPVMTLGQFYLHYMPESEEPDTFVVGFVVSEFWLGGANLEVFLSKAYDCSSLKSRKETIQVKTVNEWSNLMAWESTRILNDQN